MISIGSVELKAQTKINANKITQAITWIKGLFSPRIAFSV